MCALYDTQKQHTNQTVCGVCSVPLASCIIYTWAIALAQSVIRQIDFRSDTSLKHDEQRNLQLTVNSSASANNLLVFIFGHISTTFFERERKKSFLSFFSSFKIRHICCVLLFFFKQFLFFPLIYCLIRNLSPIQNRRNFWRNLFLFCF